MSLSAYLPVEVAVKGTLGNAVLARAALTKAEGKVAKLEAQIATLVELHEAASAELEASRTKLAEAEAATARAASVALPPEHDWTAVSSDPGPFWAAFTAVIAQRCPGMPEGVLGQLDAATKAFESALTPIFVHATSSSSPSACPNGAAVPPPVPAAPVAANTNSGGHQPPNNQGDSNPGDGGGPLSAAGNLALAPHGGRGEPKEVPMQDQTSPAAAAAAATAAEHEEAAKQAAAAAAAIAQQQAAAAAAAAAQLQQQQMQQQAAAAAAAAAALAANGVPVDGNRNAADDDHELGGGGGGPVDGGTNDSMGGGAADGIANKRNFDAVGTAKAIAARAKAKPAA